MGRADFKYLNGTRSRLDDENRDILKTVNKNISCVLIKKEKKGRKNERTNE